MQIVDLSRYTSCLEHFGFYYMPASKSALFLCTKRTKIVLYFDYAFFNKNMNESLREKRTLVTYSSVCCVLCLIFITLAQ